MIDLDDIATALGERLFTLDPSLVVAWEGKDFPAGGPHPFLYFEMVPVGSSDSTLDGSGEIQIGFAMIHVMTKPNGFATEGRRIGNSIKALFPYGKTEGRFAIPGGSVTISSHPEVQKGYPDGPHWRTPVKIPYSAS